MRALLFFAVLLVFPSIIFAQDQGHLANAQEFYKTQDFEKAANSINLAIQDKKEVKKAETWFFRGKIYYSLATVSETPSSSEDKIRFHRTSAEAFKKAKTLDNKNEYSVSIDKTLKRMNEVFINEGLINFNAKDYSNAVLYFELSSDVLAATGQFDTIAVYNAGMAYEKLNKIDSAYARYRVCADLNYGGPAVYDFMYTLLSINRRTDEANKVLEEGATKYPNDVSLLRSQLKVCVKSKQSEKALKLINNAIDSNPKSAILYLMRGALKEKLHLNGADIVKDYQTAISLREDYFDGNQKLGLYYFKEGLNKITASCNIEKAKKAKELEKQGQADLKESIIYLEKARALKSYDRRTLETLKIIYSRLEMMKEYDEVIVQLKS